MEAEDKKIENSMQFLFMEISKGYAGKCLQRIRELEIQPSQMPILMMVEKYNGCSQKEMAEKMRNKPSTVNVSIQRLERTGLVYRSRDEKDQRVTKILLTEKGRDTVRSIHEYVSEAEEIMFGGFSDTELCLMRRFFQQILENIDRIPGDPIPKCMLEE